MATVVRKTIKNHDYLYRVEYISPGKQKWDFLGKPGAVGVETGPIPDSTSKDDLLTNDDSAADTDSTDIELIDPDEWERNTTEEPVEHGAEKNAEKAEAVSWKLDRDRMDGGNLLVKASPQKETGKWEVNLGFIDELESKQLVVADTREEALEKANRWLHLHSDDPPTNPEQVKPLYEDHVTNGHITDEATAEHWGETHVDEDLAEADYDGFSEHEANKRRRRTTQARKERAPVTNGVIERNTVSHNGDWRVGLSEQGQDAADTAIGFAAANADEDDYPGDLNRLSGMSRPSFHVPTGDSKTMNDRDIEDLEAAVTWLDEEHDENPEVDGFSEVRELLAEHRDETRDGDY